MALIARARPAFPTGPCYIASTPNGEKVIAAGNSDLVRIYSPRNPDDEPETLDDRFSECYTAIATSNDFCILGCDDGRVGKLDLKTKTIETLIRFSLPVRDIDVTKDGNWAAIASDEVVVKLVNIHDSMNTIELRDHPDSVKHVSFNPIGSELAVSCRNGTLYFYSISSQEPRLLKALPGLITQLRQDSESSSKVVWFVNSQSFGIPTNTRDFQLVGRSTWSKSSAYENGHEADITAAAWSPNGRLLVTTSLNRKMVLWDAINRTKLKVYDHLKNTVISLAWHAFDNTLIYTTNEGEVYIHEKFLSEEHLHIMSNKVPLTSTAFPGMTSGPDTDNNATDRPHNREHTPGSISDILEVDGNIDDDYDDNFVVDDDDGGYAERVNSNGKRMNGNLATYENFKRHRLVTTWNPGYHASFQPGSTPWKGNRRYLAVNLIGVIWTTGQEGHNSITVEFYDRDFMRDFHFTDAFQFDKACLASHGCVFASQYKSPTDLAQIYYRPHETWTQRIDWRTYLPPRESISAIALSDTCIVACTDTGYIRTYSLFGVPLRIHRSASGPTITCAAFRNYVMIVSNGPVGADAMSQVVYSIENVKRDETIQSNEIVAIAPGHKMANLLISDVGDPYIYDTSGTLLVLSRWRERGQAKWIPLLDTNLMDRQVDGRRSERYWPVAVADNRFHCFILKGVDEHTPYFPRPLLSDFGFAIPLSKKLHGQDDSDDPAPSNELEHTIALSSVLSTLLRSTLAHTRATAAQETELARLVAETDKAFLQLLGEECRAGEAHGMKALELCELMPNGNGRMLDLARKVALRFGRDALAERIDELEANRTNGKMDMDGDDEE